MIKKKDMQVLYPEEEEEDKKPEKPLVWKEPEPPSRFKYDDSGFPLNDDRRKKDKS